MATSDSMFLFEIVVEELKSLIDCKKFCIISQFADIFNFVLKDPNELDFDFVKRSRRRKLKKTSKVRKCNEILGKLVPNLPKVETGQSILFTSNINSLKLNMKKFPMELSLFRKSDVKDRLGSTLITWSRVFIEYLNKLDRKVEPSPVTTKGEYSVFDELTSKRMATIKINIKLTYLKDKITTQFRSLSEDKSDTFIYTNINSKATQFLSTVRDPDEVFDTGIIKTIYNDEKHKLKKYKRNKSKHSKSNANNENIKNKSESASFEKNSLSKLENRKNNYKCGINFVKSATSLENDKVIEIIKCRSQSSINKTNLNALNYIFVDEANLRNKVYCVGYVTIQNEFKDPPSGQPSDTNQEPEQSVEKYKFKLCESECPSKQAEDGSCSEGICSVDLPAKLADGITVTKCDQIDCNNKKQREVPSPPDDRILFDLTNLNNRCCNIPETYEEVVGGMKAKIKFTEDPCFCSCECQFGFTKKTTYCKVCGGYEVPGEEMVLKPGHELPHPCPIFHKLLDKGKLKNWSTSGSDSKKKDGELSQKSSKSRSPSEKRASDKKSGESEKDCKKIRKDKRFKFNYGYTAPKIGHVKCAMPCTGTLGVVPRKMGWLWTAEDVPGMKFRPMWKPGATNKHVVRMLRMAKNPGTVITKKRRKDAMKKKPLIRPLLLVHKKDGEFTVTMETMKTYQKPRAINQYPYENKPVLTYTIGRTDEENRERQRKKERAQRRMERAQREFIQSAFRDMCREICIKTYQQALGILPDAEKPDCPCLPAHPGPESGINVDVSCSCSDDNSTFGSDTDSDEWFVEFTPPVATFDPKFKVNKVITQDNWSQYTYLDYRVKLVDRFGKPIQRFFKGPDGKQQCSDLGGFWNPEHKWLEINVDGYIAPDGRWAPNIFTGPNGEQVEAESGKFQANNGNWLVVGVDGYVDCQGRWRYYSRPRGGIDRNRAAGKKGGAGDKKDVKGLQNVPSEATWSCFGDASPKQLSKMGIIGHGHDRKLLDKTLKEMLARGEDVSIPKPPTIPRLPPSKKGKKRTGQEVKAYDSRSYFVERMECRHPVPSEKGIVAVDERGNKTYFRLKDYKNKRPKERIHDLKQQGISLSSFHVPCFHSFVNSELMKQQIRNRILGLSRDDKNVATQTG